LSFQEIVPYGDRTDPKPMPAKTAIKSFLSNSTFGSLNQLRVELETTYNGVQITLDSEDNKKIDCMFFPGIARDPADEGKEEFVMPTMIYCGGNAMFYENWQFDSDWLEFYRGNGINVFAWNYRGFGSSEGSPNPAKMFDDAEMVVEYLRNIRGIKQSKVLM
jgi:pimeloyl-ACP methyl ester carboxylesterase